MTQPVKTLAIASLAVMAIFLDTTVLFVAFEDIAATFDSVSRAELSWVLNAYTIAIAALLVPAGKLADRTGHKRVFLAGSVVFTAASVACALAPTAPALVVFRVLQAAGGAALIPSSFALVLRAFPRERIPFAVAVWGGSGAVMAALGPTLGAALVEWASWRWAFLANLPVGIVTVGLGLGVLRESRDPSTQVPAVLGIALIGAVGALLSLAAVQSDQWGWADGRTVGALVGGAVLLGAFVLHQRRTARPVLDLQLFALRNFRWANAGVLVFGLAFSAMFFGSILFLTQVWQWSTLEAGLGVSPGPILAGALTPWAGKLAGRFGQRPLIVTGGVAFALGGLWRVVATETQPDYAVAYLPTMLLTGLGVVLALPPLVSAVGQALPPTHIGVGGAASQAFRQLGGTFGVAFTIALIGTPTSAVDALGNFDRVWWLFAAGGLVTSLLAVRLDTRSAGARTGAPSTAPAGSPTSSTSAATGTAVEDPAVTAAKP